MGELAEPGQDVMLISNLETVWIWADIYERDLSALLDARSQGAIPVRLDGGDGCLRSQLVEYAAKRGLFQMILGADKKEIAFIGKHTDDLFDHGPPIDRNQWLERIVTGSDKAQSGSGHWDDNLHCAIFSPVRRRLPQTPAHRGRNPRYV